MAKTYDVKNIDQVLAILHQDGFQLDATLVDHNVPPQFRKWVFKKNMERVEKWVEIKSDFSTAMHRWVFKISAFRVFRFCYAAPNNGGFPKLLLASYGLKTPPDVQQLWQALISEGEPRAQ